MLITQEIPDWLIVYLPGDLWLVDYPQEIPDWLVEYANSHDQEYEWVEESYKDLDKYQTMMTRLYRQELKHVIEEYEVGEGE